MWAYLEDAFQNLNDLNLSVQKKKQILRPLVTSCMVLYNETVVVESAYQTKYFASFSLLANVIFELGFGRKYQGRNQSAFERAKRVI